MNEILSFTFKNVSVRAVLKVHLVVIVDETTNKLLKITMRIWDFYMFSEAYHESQSLKCDWWSPQNKVKFLVLLHQIVEPQMLKSLTLLTSIQAAKTVTERRSNSHGTKDITNMTFLNNRKCLRSLPYCK